MDTATNQDKLPKHEIEAAWVELFATVWRDTEWSQYDRAKTSRTDIFGEKVLSAANKQTPEQVLDELCRRFGLAASTLSTEAFETLRAEPKRAVTVLRENRVFLAAKTRSTIDAYYDALSDDSDQEADPDEQTTDLSDFIQIDE